MRISMISGVLRSKSAGDISLATLPCQARRVRYLSDGNVGSIAQNCLQKVFIHLIFYNFYLRYDGNIKLVRTLWPLQGHLVWRGEKGLRKNHFAQNFIDIVDQILILLVIFHLLSWLIAFLRPEQNIFLSRVLNKLEGVFYQNCLVQSRAGQPVQFALTHFLCQLPLSPAVSSLQLGVFPFIHLSLLCSLFSVQGCFQGEIVVS